MTPSHPFDAYTKTLDEESVTDDSLWLIIGEVSKCYPTFHVKAWRDIVTDLNTKFPQFFNLRKSELGIQEKTTPSFQPGGSKAGGNLHCILEFSAEK